MSDSVEIELSIIPKPWMCQEAIDILDYVIKSIWDPNVLEFGSGGSTIWLATRSFYANSVENNPEWAKRVQFELAARKMSNWSMHVSNWDDVELDIATQTAVIDRFPDDFFELIFVDNNSKDYAPTKLREKCIRAAYPKLKNGGWFVLDNINYDYVTPALELFEGWPKIEVHNGIWHTGFYHKAPVEEAWYT